LLKVLDRQTGYRFEVIYIDDGSHDATLQYLRNLQAGEPRVRVVALSRNFGHQMAVTAGLEHASGHAVVVMDADLQDPPEMIGKMLESWCRGVDVVYGVRASRAGESISKRWSASLFYRLIVTLSDVEIPLDTGDFQLMDRCVVDAFLAMPERDRFVRGMIAWVGFRQEPVYYQRQARSAGETKYPLRKMLHFAMGGSPHQGWLWGALSTLPCCAFSPRPGFPAGPSCSLGSCSSAVCNWWCLASWGNT